MAAETTEDWWPERLKILELQYENSKLRVFENGLRSKKWKKEIDLLINDERLHTESLRYEKLSRRYREQERLLQDQIKSLEKELKESKAILCQTKASLEDVKETSKAEKERLTSEAEERLAKQQEEFEKEKDTLNKEVDEWKNVKEKLEEEMKETAKAQRQEVDEKTQQALTANTEIVSLKNELHMWKDKHAKLLQERDRLQKEIADNNVSKATKATQTQNKMVNKAVMVGVECATIGMQAGIPTECDREVAQTQNKMVNKAVMVGAATTGMQAGIPTECDREVAQTQNKMEKCITVCLEAGLGAEWDSKLCKMLPPKKAGVRNNEEANSVDQTSCSKNSKQLEKDIHDNRQEKTNGGATKAEQKRTGNSRKSIQNKPEKTSNEKDEVQRGEECIDVPTRLPGNGSTGRKSNSCTSAPENLSNGKMRKRKCTKEPCKIDGTNAKKTKKGCKNRGSLVNKVENKNRVLEDDTDQKERFCDNDKKDTPFYTADKQRKTSEPTNKESILKDDQTGSAKGKRPGTAFGLSKPKYPSSQPSLSDRTRQSSVAEMSSILNGTKRQRTLLNPKDTSLMVSFLPVQESLMNSTMSRGNKPNGTMPPSLSSFMRSFIAPKLKTKST